MFSMKRSTVLPMSIAIAALSTLAACGGSGDDHAPPVAQNPQPPAQPTQPTTPTQPTPPTQPTTPTDPGGTTDIALEPGYTRVSAAAGFSQPYWPAWTRPATTVVDGVGCAQSEAYHQHAMLSVYRNGVRLALPDGIGRVTGCAYEMHTHDGTGVIHIEADKPVSFTLRQFLSLWGQSISATSVLGLPGPAKYYVVENEKITPVTTDPLALTLAGHKEIVIIVGTPPAALPRYDWVQSGL